MIVNQIITVYTVNVTWKIDHVNTIRWMVIEFIYISEYIHLYFRIHSYRLCYLATKNITRYDIFYFALQTILHLHAVFKNKFKLLFANIFRCDECSRLLWSGWVKVRMFRIYPGISGVHTRGLTKAPSC